MEKPLIIDRIERSKRSKPMDLLADIGSIVAGIVLMVAGSYLLVRGASNLALRLGVSDLIIGATVVALGTSLPELFAVVVSSAQGKAGIGLGNIAGSNILNVLAILGLGIMIMPITISRSEVNPETVIFLIIGTLYLLYALLIRHQIGRLDGAILFTCFLLFSVLSLRRQTG